MVPWIAAQRSVVQRVETIVVGESHVSSMLQQQRQHIITFLRDGVMERSVTFRILQEKSYVSILFVSKVRIVVRSITNPRDKPQDREPVPAVSTFQMLNYKASPVSSIATIF